MPAFAQSALKCALPAQNALPGALPFSFSSWNTGSVWVGEPHTDADTEVFIIFCPAKCSWHKTRRIDFAFIAFINNACYEQYVIKSTLAQYESLMSNGKKVCAEFKFSQCRWKVTVKVTCLKFMEPSERSCHKEL